MNDIVKQVEDSPAFQKTDMQGYYLAHLFCSEQHGQQTPWQVGYYDAKNDQMITFDLQTPIKKEEATQMLKEPGKTIQKLELNDIVSFDDAKKKAFTLLNEKYHTSAHKSAMYLLQQVSEWGTIWNFTFVLVTWQTVNVKLDAHSGEVLHDSVHNLLDIRGNKV